MWLCYSCLGWPTHSYPPAFLVPAPGTWASWKPLVREIGRYIDLKLTLSQSGSIPWSCRWQWCPWERTWERWQYPFWQRAVWKVEFCDKVLGIWRRREQCLVMVWAGSGDCLWLPWVRCRGWKSTLCCTGRRITYLPAGVVEGLSRQFCFLFGKCTWVCSLCSLLFPPTALSEGKPHQQWFCHSCHWIGLQKFTFKGFRGRKSRVLPSWRVV